MRAVIKFFFLKGLSATETKNELDSVLGHSSPSFSCVSFWHSEFKRGRKHTQDEARSGRPETARVAENVEKIRKEVEENSRISTRVLAKDLKMSTERVRCILHDELKMKKIAAKWVPHSFACNIRATIWSGFAEILRISNDLDTAL